MQTCNKCGIDKPFNEYHKNRCNPNGYHKACKVCRGVEAKASWLRRGDTIKKLNAGYALKTKYGISMDDYEEMYEQQDGRCAICYSSQINGSRLCVDHDHQTGEVRGLLCHSCNMGLGYLKDCPTRVASALMYLSP